MPVASLATSAAVEPRVRLPLLAAPSARRRWAAPLVVAGLVAGTVLSAPPAYADAVPAVRGTATTTASIRTAADADAPVLATLDAGQRITTTAPAANGWLSVTFRSGTAYVSAAQLSLSTTAEPPRPASISTTGTKIATAKLVVRSGPAKSQPAVGSIAAGSALRLTGLQRGGYVQTTYAKQPRWVSVRYLASQSPAFTALDFAAAQLGKPYKYGATGPKAFDCSGLTLSSWKAAGVSLPRTAAQQSRFGRKVKKADLQPGDLVFFYGSTPSHVALYVGNGMVIHSPRPGKTVQYLKMSSMPYSGARRPA